MSYDLWSASMAETVLTAPYHENHLCLGSRLLTTVKLTLHPGKGLYGVFHSTVINVILSRTGQVHWWLSCSTSKGTIQLFWYLYSSLALSEITPMVVHFLWTCITHSLLSLILYSSLFEVIKVIDWRLIFISRLKLVLYVAYVIYLPRKEVVSIRIKAVLFTWLVLLSVKVEMWNKKIVWFFHDIYKYVIQKVCVIEVYYNIS